MEIGFLGTWVEYDPLHVSMCGTGKPYMRVLPLVPPYPLTPLPYLPLFVACRLPHLPLVPPSLPACPSLPTLSPPLPYPTPPFRHSLILSSHWNQCPAPGLSFPTIHPLPPCL